MKEEKYCNDEPNEAWSGNVEKNDNEEGKQCENEMIMIILILKWW